MTRAQVCALHPHDQVTWNDPDAGECSGTLRILNIRVLESTSVDPVCQITRTDGSYLEVYASELS